MKVALYIHIPFCQQRCNYCDFNTWAGLGQLIGPYMAALELELGLLRRSSKAEWQATTLYFGGGTPSLAPAELLQSVLVAAQVGRGAEISLEANPGTVSSSALSTLRRAGVNRLSLGMQSANADELALLGRLHDFPAVVDAVRWARAAGFDNINLDLIYGLPGQGTATWEQTLNAALSLTPEHLSLYALSVEPETPLAQWVDQGRIPEPDPDLAADMYDLAREKLAAAGYLQYEISNWARPGKECRHNLAYWRNSTYLGVGAGAWGHWPQTETGWRMRNVTHPQVYLERMQLASRPEEAPIGPPISPAGAEWEFISRPLTMAETMFMGLRLTEEGVSRRRFETRFGSDPAEVYAKTLTELAQTELIEWDDERIRLLPGAVLISNQVFAAFLPSCPAPTVISSPS